MSVDVGVEERGVSDLREMDEAEFSTMAERHRRELHVHCYRMLGSFEDAEDTVQETFLRAWRRRETFEGRSTFRAWLYRIATNACLDLLAKKRPKAATGGEVVWLQSYPDRLLGDSVHSVNSALQRARARMREHLPSERQDWTGGEETAETRDLVRRFTEASAAVDIDAIAAMLREDVRYAMPPTPGVYVGRDIVLQDWADEGYDQMTGLRAVPMAVNRQPAVAYYHWREDEGAYLLLTIDVIRISGGAITEVYIFHADQFPRLGLPERLSADGTERS